MINATNLTNNPFIEILSPYTNSILGSYFYGIIFIFIIGAVYIKTRNLVSTSAMMIVIAGLFSAVLTASGAGLAILMIFYVFTALGMVALIAGIILEKGR